MSDASRSVGNKFDQKALGKGENVPCQDSRCFLLALVKKGEQCCSSTHPIGSRLYVRADASVVKPRLLLLAINVVPEFLFSICRPRNLYVAANCAEVNNRKDIYPTNVCVTVQPFMDIYSCKVTDVV